MLRPEHGRSTDNKVDGGEIPEFQAVESTSRVHLRTQNFKRVTLKDHLRQHPPMLARSRALLAPDDLEVVVQK